jgi:hypothetical protein
MAMTKKIFEKVGGVLRPEWQPKTAYSDGLTKSFKPRAADIPWDFGWIPPFARDEEQHKLDHDVMAQLPRFHIEGKTQETDKAFLFEFWRSPETKAALGYDYPGTHQLTGSCVGAGGGNAHFTLSAIEVIRLGDPEQIIVPHWLFTYGRSRFHAGMRGRGEGSFGAAYVKAAMQDGILPSNLEGLPKFKNDDGLIWGASTEMEWSAGDQRPVQDWMDKAKKHLVKTTARCRNADDVEQAIMNGYPCTCASMYAHDGGTVTSDPPVLLGRRRGSWAHQMSYNAVWRHPKLGRIFYLPNQWGLGAHGKDPIAPPGGVWVVEADVDWVCRDEVFAFSQFDGFPAQTFLWTT